MLVAKPQIIEHSRDWKRVFYVFYLSCAVPYTSVHRYILGRVLLQRLVSRSETLTRNAFRVRVWLRETNNSQRSTEPDYGY